VLTAWVWKGRGTVGIEENLVAAGVEHPQKEQAGRSGRVWRGGRWDWRSAVGLESPARLEECGRSKVWGPSSEMSTSLLWSTAVEALRSWASSGGDRDELLLHSEWRWRLAGGQEKAAATGGRWCLGGKRRRAGDGAWVGGGDGWHTIWSEKWWPGVGRR
jgi:hypothetical protein